MVVLSDSGNEQGNMLRSKRCIKASGSTSSKPDKQSQKLTRFISRECSHLVFSGERDGPLVPSVAEVLGDDVAVKVARHGLRDDEREDLGVDAVVQLKVASQERHLADNWRI